MRDRRKYPCCRVDDNCVEVRRNETESATLIVEECTVCKRTHYIGVGKPLHMKLQES
jgi:hypothetical protein